MTSTVQGAPKHPPPPHPIDITTAIRWLEDSEEIMQLL